MNIKKQRLIEVLEAEEAQLEKQGVDTRSHFLTIDYLKTGSYGCDPTEVEEYPLLEAAINEYEGLLSERGIMVLSQYSSSPAPCIDCFS